MKNRKSSDWNINSRGFTLLELMIVLSVIAVLLGWGMPSLTQSIQNNQVLAQSNELIAMLHFTKGEALRRNDDVQIDLYCSNEGWRAIVKDSAVVAEVVGCDEVEVVEECGEAGQLRCSSHTAVALSSVNELTFNNRGYIRGEFEVWNPETLFVQHAECSGNNQRRRIDITATGQISSCALACDSTAACP